MARQRQTGGANTLVRLADERLRDALGEIASGGDIATTVHAVRKRLKSARAMLWALEPLEKGRARKARRRLAKAAAMLSEARDADVIAAAASANGLKGIARRMRARAVSPDAAPIAKTGQRIAAVRKSLAVGKGLRDAPTLDSVIRRAYRSARHGWRASLAAPSTRRLHAWRKRVKRLYYLVQATPDPDPAVLDNLDILGELLGEDRDNALLAARVGGLARKKRRTIDRTRTRLQREAFAIAETLFSAGPRRFAGDLHRKVPAGRGNGSAAGALELEGDTVAPERSVTGARRRNRGSKEGAARIARVQANPERAPTSQPGPTPPYEKRTKAELYALARERDVSGRSAMNKNELIAALRGA